MNTGDLEITDELLHELTTPEQQGKAKISNIDWLFYAPPNDEDIYSWQIPGPKILLNNGISFDEGKDLADAFVSALNTRHSGNIQLVVIDIAALIKMQV